MPRLPLLTGAALATVALATVALALAASPVHAETLREALAKAYQSNPTLNAARAGLRATDENVPIALADGRPDLRATATFNEELRRLNTPLGFTQPARNLNTQATATVPIYQGGIVRNAIRSAKEGVQAGEENLRGTESSVFASVVAAYLDVIRDSAVVTFNSQNVQALETNLQASSDRFEVGDVTRTDVAQSESRLALARADLQSAKARLIASKEQYIALVGSAPEKLETPPALPGLPDSPDLAVQVALRDNPDLSAAQHQRQAAHYDANGAKGRVMPRLLAFATGTYFDYLGSEQDLNPALAPPGNSRSAVAGLQLTVPLYQGGRPGALTRQATARESQAIERTMLVERSVVAQTRSAFASWQASLQAIESTRKAVDAAALSLEGVKAENSAGTRTILDILNAEQEALNARVQYVSAQRNAYVAGFSLLAAMGHAQARDLGLEGGPLYDPKLNYENVHRKLIDFDFGPAASGKSGTTKGVPAQSWDPIIPADNN